MSNSNPSTSKIILSYLKKILQFIWHYLKIIYKKIQLIVNKISTREKHIRQNYKQYHLGNLSPNDQAYQEYQNAVFKNRLAGLTFKSFMKVYYRYLYPKQSNQGFLTQEQFFQLATCPQNYMVIPKTEYHKQINETISTQLEHIIAERTKAIKKNLMDKLLPFVSNEEEGEHLSDFFAQKDASRIKYYAQRKKMEELEERERKVGLKEESLTIQEEKLGVQNERVGLKSDKLDLDKKHLEIQREKLGVEQMLFENERKLFAIEMQNRDMEHKIKMLELMNMSLEIQRKTNDIERFKKEFQVMQGLHDLEMKNRENLVTHGQQLLQLKEQGLENQMALKEAEFLRQQSANDRLKIDIEGKLLQLREGQFSQKAKELLLDIREKSSDLKIQEGKYDLKQLHEKKEDYEQDIALLGDIMASRKQIVLTLEGEMAMRKEKMHQNLKSINQSVMSVEEHRNMEELKRSQMFQDIYYEDVSDSNYTVY
ncbi:hypothetical protein [Aureispira sp. CCB-QB1]|uniref:hypothetical protein n=1 Tax=Aureispira sp. CCB-QB1 TaxID=1313421 RepID=UPI0006991BFB|nr:hypothetical protein [Aureispira sp. CCB-QB1]